MPGNHAERLALAARKAAARQEYMAHILAQYQRRERLSETELIQSLGMSDEDYVRLMLCKAPSPHAADYAQRVARIAAYSGAPAGKLAHILRAVQQPAAMHGAARPSPALLPWQRILDGLRRAFSPRSAGPVLRWAAAAAVVCLALLAFAALGSEPGTPQTAALSLTQGQVDVASAGGDWQAGAPSVPIKAGDQIRTQPQAVAALTLFDGSRLDLDAGAQLSVLEMNQRQDGSRTMTFRQAAGRVCFTVQALPDARSRFEVHTPSAVVRVRGTQFVVAVAADGATGVDVIEGLVEVTAQDEAVTLRAGESVQVQPGRPPQAATRAQPTPASTTTPADPPPVSVTPQPSAVRPSPAPTSGPMMLPSTATSEALLPTSTFAPLISTPQPSVTRHIAPGQTKTPHGLDKTPPGQERKDDPPDKDNKEDKDEKSKPDKKK